MKGEGSPGSEAEDKYLSLEEIHEWWPWSP